MVMVRCLGWLAVAVADLSAVPRSVPHSYASNVAEVCVGTAAPAAVTNSIMRSEQGTCCTVSRETRRMRCCDTGTRASLVTVHNAETRCCATSPLSTPSLKESNGVVP